MTANRTSAVQRTLGAALPRWAFRALPGVHLGLGLVGLIALLTAGSLAGCGCYYGAPSAVSISPEMSCLEAVADGGCSDFTVHLQNHCAEAVSLISSTKGPVQLAPDQSMSLPFSEYGELTEDEETCRGKVVIPAALGQLNLMLEFSFGLVNRGVGVC